MSNSPLVNYTRLSPNFTRGRKHSIDTITIHCMACNASVERLGEIFAPPARQASSQYGIGSDGRIGQYVDEANRSWCTSSSVNDNRAITIEVASENRAPYKVTDTALARLIDLLTDICKRNGIPALLWKADSNLIGHVDKQNMTVHRWFANKSCPGNYLYSLHGHIAKEVNKRLQAALPSRGGGRPTVPPTLSKGSNGENVKLLQTLLNAHGAKLKVDGDFGKLTEAAVRAFQKANGLQVDGIAGPLTHASLLQ